MFKEIEERFKSIESHRRNGIFMIIFFVIYIVIALFMLENIQTNYVLIIVPALIVYLLIYLYIVINNLKNKLYSKNKWFFIFDVSFSLKLFNKEQRRSDKSILIEILKKNCINTRPKVGKILDHYRVLIPRNVNEKTTILSVLAFLISILAFLYDSNVNVLQDKLVSLIVVLVIATIGYISFIILSKEVSVFFGKKTFYIRVEDLLTEIYIKSEIK